MEELIKKLRLSVENLDNYVKMMYNPSITPAKEQEDENVDEEAGSQLLV